VSLGFLPRSTAIHEAHHVAAMSVLGLTPKHARIDHPRDGLAGSCSVDWDDDGVDERKARRLLVAIVVGGTVEGGQGWDVWPIDPDNVAPGARGDAEHAAIVCEYVGITDRASWLFVLFKANRLARKPEFRRLAVAISEELERVEVLDADDLRKLIEETGARYER
jgi:hypothetical protein